MPHEPSRIELDPLPQHERPERRKRFNLVREERESKRTNIEVRLCMSAIKALFAYVDGEREADAIKDALWFLKSLERGVENG